MTVQAAQLWAGRAAEHSYLHVVQAAGERRVELGLFRAMFGLATLQLPRNFTNTHYVCYEKTMRENETWTKFSIQTVGEIGTMLVPWYFLVVHFYDNLT